MIYDPIFFISSTSSILFQFCSRHCISRQRKAQRSAKQIWKRVKLVSFNKKVTNGRQLPTFHTHFTPSFCCFRKLKIAWLVEFSRAKCRIFPKGLVFVMIMMKIHGNVDFLPFAIQKLPFLKFGTATNAVRTVVEKSVKMSDQNTPSILDKKLLKMPYSSFQFLPYPMRLFWGSFQPLWLERKVVENKL